jgi:hypothetical protein
LQGILLETGAIMTASPATSFETEISYFRQPGCLRAERTHGPYAERLLPFGRRHVSVPLPCSRKHSRRRQSHFPVALAIEQVMKFALKIDNWASAARLRCNDPANKDSVATHDLVMMQFASIVQIAVVNRGAR